MEKHQYGFAILNTCTGGVSRKSFWGYGENEVECRKDASRQAHAYAEQKAAAAYQRARNRNTSCYAPSRSAYDHQVVGCSLWK